MSANYFWDAKNNKVLIFDEDVLVSKRSNPHLIGMQCVDTFSITQFRYGYWLNNDWHTLRPELLDPEFRTHLLLLGVT